MKNLEILGVFSVQITADIEKEITLLKIPVERIDQLRHDLKQKNYRPCRNAVDVLSVLRTYPTFQSITGVNDHTRIASNDSRPNTELFFVFAHEVDDESPYLFLDVENYSRGTHYRPVGMLVEKHHE